MVLSVQNLSKAFGGLQALHEATFDIAQDQIKSLIGPNGAGKTTALNLLSGVYPYDSGEIIFQGINLKRLAHHQIASLGMARTFQNGGLFLNLDVLNNILVGYHCRVKISFISSMFRLPNAVSEEKRIKDKALQILDELELFHKYNNPVDSLSLKEQRFVEIAIALVIEPKLILLDEPCAGLNDTEIYDLKRLLFKIREKGISILLVEHNMDLVMGVSDDIVVLNYGRKLAEGTPHEIRNDKKVIEAYLGE